MRMSMIVIVVGSLAILLGVVFVSVFVPGFVWHPDQTLSAHPMTAEEYRGYTIYYQNQCWTCHTIYSRYWESSGYPKSQPGDYEFYMPVPLGSERTGPDLSYVGRKRSMQWEIDHLKEPRAYSPMSIMPSFSFLSEREAQAIADYLFFLGDRTAAEFMVASPAAYAASKWAVIGITQALAMELAPYKINVNSINPGFFPTNLRDEDATLHSKKKGITVEEFRKDEYKMLSDMVPLKRMGTVEDIADLIYFLVSDQSKYLTGQSINITGGTPPLN